MSYSWRSHACESVVAMLRERRAFLQMYPQLLQIVETDSTGHVLAQPSHFIPPTTTGK